MCTLCMDRKWWPAPLWDRHALVPGAPFLWGSPDQLCSILNATDNVALVGNGPLTSEQRQAINQAGRVVRINALNNRQALHHLNAVRSQHADDYGATKLESG